MSSISFGVPQKGTAEWGQAENVRFAPILSDFRWGFADPGKQSADVVQFRADFVRFGVFANQTKSDKISATPLGQPLLGTPDS